MSISGKNVNENQESELISPIVRTHISTKNKCLILVIGSESSLNTNKKYFNLEIRYLDEQLEKFVD